MTAYAPFLARMTELIEGPGLTRDPLPLLALRDALEAHDDESPAGVLLWAALTHFHKSALLRRACAVEDSLTELDRGKDILTAFCVADR